ncbi:protein SFI1 homolog isoform X2 [Apus apus]|uniref:protein SFI1 homolog isoform X2 n=1 Tax=Apus apus TaxID=8895 RepID=UPI0021F8AF79|nr:protein SFI1 homolog isoform X2 [Apus apus]
MEKSRSSSKSLKMHEIQQLQRHQMSATGQSVALQSARPQFQDTGHDNLDDVGYIWHQKRRLKEFQIRYLARKFFYLWAKKTFGQVLPSKARCFYDQKILQKTFEEWWAVCGERKLSFRAESHYRHLLHNLIFKAWRAYICQQQEKRNKYCVAESHARKQTLLKTWRCWLLYVDVQRIKHGMQAVALAFRERSCLCLSWAVWRQRYYQNVLALQHWAQSLQFRAWWQWWELYLYSQNDRQKETRAVAHHQHWELKRCMEVWLRYLHLQRAKKHQNERAQEHHQSRMVRQCFSKWHLSWECRRRMRAQEEDTEKLAGRIAQQMDFAHWKHYVVLYMEDTRQRELAEKHYKHHLLKLGFKGLWQNVMTTHLQQMRRNLAYCQHEVTVLQKFWNCWKSRLEKKEEEQQQALTEVAYAHYRRLLMRQVFDTWLLRTCKQQEYQRAEKRAVLHFERQLLRGFWCFWHRRTAARLEEQKGLVCASNHYSNLLLLKAFCLWKQNTQERKMERLKEMQALRFHYSKCLQHSWHKWREYVGHQREKWKKLVEAEVHYQHTLLSKTLAAWKSYQHNVQCILSHVAEKEKQHRRRQLRQLLGTWRENALEAKATARADEHYRRAILSKVLLQWKYTVLLQGYYCQQKRTAVMEARRHLNTLHLQALFLRWKKLTWESLLMRAQQHRAVQHHQQHLLQKYLVKWKKYHQQCLGHMLLQQPWEEPKTAQALWHWSLSLQRKVFDAWHRFAKEQQQKKDSIEKSTGVHHTTFLREGAAWVLSYTAGMKQLQGQLQAQHQLKQQVALKMPDVGPEARGHSTGEEPSKCDHPPFHLADGNSIFRDLTAIQRARLLPQRPDFLLESLGSKELLRPPFTRSEAPFQQTSVNKCAVQSGNLMLTPQMEISPCKCLSQTGNTTQSCPSAVPAALLSVPLWTPAVHHPPQSPELRTPSSFMPQMKAGAEMRGRQPVSGHNGAHSQDSQKDSVEKLQANLQPHLLSPEDLVGKKNCQTAEGEEREHSCREEMAFQRELEMELQGIQEQMQYYCSRNQELKACQQQAQLLRKWLKMNLEPKDDDHLREAQEELHWLQVRIQTLTQAQSRARCHVQNLLVRLHDIQTALDT